MTNPRYNQFPFEKNVEQSMRYAKLAIVNFEKNPKEAYRSSAASAANEIGVHFDEKSDGRAVAITFYKLGLIYNREDTVIKGNYDSKLKEFGDPREIEGILYDLKKYDETNEIISRIANVENAVRKAYREGDTNSGTFFVIGHAFSIIAVIGFFGHPVVGVIFAIPAAFCYLNGMSEKEASRTNPNAYHERQESIKKQNEETIENERLYAEASQSSDVPWEKRYYTFPCPHCGHYKVRDANWDDKKMSVAFWGIYSHRIAEHYKCDSSKSMW